MQTKELRLAENCTSVGHFSSCCDAKLLQAAEVGASKPDVSRTLCMIVVGASHDLSCYSIRSSDMTLCRSLSLI